MTYALPEESIVILLPTPSARGWEVGVDTGLGVRVGAACDLANDDTGLETRPKSPAAMR